MKKLKKNAWNSYVLILGLLFSINSILISSGRIVTFSGAAANFVSKDNVTLTKGSTTTWSGTINCINTSILSYTSFNTSTEGHYKFTLDVSTEKIDSIKIIWRSNTTSHRLPIMFSNSDITIGSVGGVSSVATAGTGGFTSTAVISSSGVNNCPGEIVKWPTGATVKSILLNRVISYESTKSPNTLYTPFNGRIASTTGIYNTLYGNANTAYLGELLLYISSECTPHATRTVSGTTTICSGSSTNITLGSSQSGVTYQLFAGASPSGNPVPGSGSDLVWAVSPASTTTYTVRTTTAGGFCETTMSGSAVVTVNQPPTTANAGVDINLTMPTVSTALAANTPSIGTGAWSIVSGLSSNTSQFSSLSSPTATFTADGGAGAYVLRWTISNSPCTPSSDDVTVNIASATVPTISKTSGPNNQSVSAGASVESIVFTWAGTAISAAFTWTGSSVTTPAGINESSGSENKTITISGTPATAGTYQFSVRSTNGTDYSDPLTGTLSVKLPAPGVSDATTRTNQGFTANWSDITGESGYKVNVYQGVNLVKVESGISANSTSVAISGLLANTTYTYKVVAVGNGDDIPDSDESVASNSVRTLNTARAITAFSIPGQISSVIDEGTFSITVSMPQNFSLTNLIPSITVSSFATVNPQSGVGQDFSVPVQYTVTAEDGNNNQAYTVNVIFGSQASDFFRSKAHGNWNTASTWESSFNNLDWINATITPGTNAPTVTINNDITVISPITINDVVVNVGRKLILSSGGSISVNSGKTLIVNGILENGIFASANPFSGSGSIVINGIFDLTATPTSNLSADAIHIPVATWGINSTCRVSGVRSTTDTDYTQLRGVSQTFNNFEINTPNLVGKLLLQGTEQFGNAANFIVNHTGNSATTRQGIQLSTSTSPRTGMTVQNYTQNAGLVHIVSNSSSTVGRSFTVNGNFVLNGGTFNVAQYTTNGATTNVTVRGNLTVASGTILQKDIRSTGSGNHGNVRIIFDGNTIISDNGTIRDLDGLTVNSGNSITLNAGSRLSGTSPIINNGVININSDATGTATIISAVTGTGTTNIQQHLTSGRNWYFASPVSNATSNVIKGLAGNTKLWERNVAGNSWTEITATNVGLTQGRGYIGKIAETGTVTFSGTLNDGQIQLPISSHAIASGKFHLVGNPYASYLDWQSVVAANPGLMPTMWFRTKSATDAYMFATVLMSDAMPIVSAPGANTTVTKLIPPMQGFWVRISDLVESTNFTVNNTMRSHIDHSGNRFKAPATQPQLLRLEISNGIHNDEAVVYFNSNASDAFDRYDSPKMFNNNVAIPEIYTRAGNERLVINGMNGYNFNTMIPLGFNAGQAGSFSIRASQLQNFDSDTQVYLFDKASHRQFNLSEGESYSFTSDAINTEERFAVLFKSASGVSVVQETTTSGMYLSTNNGRITLQLNTALDNARVTVYSLAGQSIYSQSVAAPTTLLNKTLEAGVYMVKVVNGGRCVVLRTIIQ